MTRRKKGSYNKSTNKKPQGETPKKKVLAMSSSGTTPEVNVLDKDLYSEYTRDHNDTASSLLIDSKWLRFFDAQSTMLSRMVALIENSPTLRNITNQKTALTMGAGFIPVSATDVPYLQTLRKLLGLKTADEKGIKAINELIGNVNFNNETLEEVVKRACFDYHGFGNAIVQLKKAQRDGEDTVMVYHVPLHQVGIKKANANGIIESIGISADWDTDGTNPLAITEIPMYPEFSKDGSSVIHLKNYAPKLFYWGLPNWISGQHWAEMEYKIPKHNNGKLDNGFKPSALIQVFGDFTDTEAETVAGSIVDGYTGTGKNGKVVVQVMRDKADAAHVTLYKDDSEGSFMELQRLAAQGVITSYGWTTSLSGIATTGKIGSNQQMLQELEFVINMEIKGVMRLFEQKIINPFVSENQKVNKALNGVMLRIANMNPISLAALIKPSEVLKKNEQREILGYEGIEEDELEQGQQVNGDGSKKPQNE